jgi:hypothetical protein
MCFVISYRLIHGHSGMSGCYVEIYSIDQYLLIFSKNQLKGGFFVLSLLNEYTIGIPFLVVGFLEVVILSWIYGKK